MRILNDKLQAAFQRDNKTVSEVYETINRLLFRE